MQKKILFYFSTIWLSITLCSAQVIQNQVFSNQIKTVKLYPSTNEVGIPVITLNSDQKLVFLFDELGEESKTYYYEIIHCNQDWTPSIQENYEYINGFSKATIDDYNYSYNTQVNYVNYRLNIPNRDMQITQSGNYALIVFEDDPSKPIITKRFVVVENIVAIDKQIVLPKTKYDYKKYQEILFNIQYQGLQINNPYTEIHASILQNQRWDNAITGVQPKFIRNSELIFDNNGEVVFEAGREFRRFDIRSLRFLGDGVRSIQGNNVYLLIDTSRNTSRYFIETDYNGQYYIDVLEQRNRNQEADYAQVYFNLATRFPFYHERLFVGGDFNNYSTDTENQLIWNPNTQMYETQIELKQGYYDYIYYLLDEKGQKSILKLEGGDYDAENEYDIFIYYRAFGERYDRIIGYLNFDTRHE